MVRTKQTYRRPERFLAAPAPGVSAAGVMTKKPRKAAVKCTGCGKKRVAVVVCRGPTHQALPRKEAVFCKDCCSGESGIGSYVYRKPGAAVSITECDKCANACKSCVGKLAEPACATERCPGCFARLCKECLPLHLARCSKYAASRCYMCCQPANGADCPYFPGVMLDGLAACMPCVKKALVEREENLRARYLWEGSAVGLAPKEPGC